MGALRPAWTYTILMFCLMCRFNEPQCKQTWLQLKERERAKSWLKYELINWVICHFPALWTHVVLSCYIAFIINHDSCLSLESGSGGGGGGWGSHASCKHLEDLNFLIAVLQGRKHSGSFYFSRFPNMFSLKNWYLFCYRKFLLNNFVI